MAYLDVLAIFTILLCMGILSGSQSTSTEEAAADDDDEIALEDYVDNELPNFSGDVSSALFGDTTGYDVHIEVKIANRSKTKSAKTKEFSETTSSVITSPKNRMKAKKILDLIIEKLKHKKDARERIDDSTDVEIEDEADKNVKRKGKLAKSSSSVKDEPLNEEAGENMEILKGDTVDSIEQRNENKGSSLPLKDQEIAPSLKSKEENMVSSATMKQQKLPSANRKKMSSSPFSTKDKDVHFSSRKKGASTQTNQHTFNIPQSDKSESKEEAYSFQKSTPHHMPKTSTLSTLEDTPVSTILKPAAKNGKSENNKYIKVKVSGDEIRIKVPEFLNKTALFSKIVELIEDDGKKSQPTKILRPKSENEDFRKKPFHSIGSKYSNSTPTYYKFLLLKKVHKDTEKPVSGELDQLNGQHIPSDAVGNLDEPAPIKAPTLHKDTINDSDEGGTIKMNSLKEKSNDYVDEISIKKKDTSFEHQEEISEKKLSHSSNPSREENSEHNLEGKEDSSERVKLHEAKEDTNDKDKAHEEKSGASDNEINEKVDGTKNEAFVPNNIASKSFQENLEPVEIPNTKPVESSNSKIHSKPLLNIVPEELRLEEADTTEKENIVAPKLGVIRPPIPSNHKLESTNSNNIVDIAKHNEDHSPKVNPGRLFNDSLFQQAGMENADSEGKQKIEKPPESEISTSEQKESHTKTINDKKIERSNQPIIDTLTFPEFSQEKPLLSVNSETSHITTEAKNDKLHDTEEIKHKSHIAAEKHEKALTAEEEKHFKSRVAGKDKKENLHSDAEDNHLKSDIRDEKHKKTESTLTGEGEKQEPVSTEKFKPLNNPLPSILFKEILHNDDTVGRLTKKGKHAKRRTKPDIEDDGKFLKKLSPKGKEEDEGRSTSISEHSHKARTKESPSKGGTKLDLSDLESLQLQSKDNLELGTDDDEEGTGDDDEYEDASGDDDDVIEMKDNPDQANLSIANLAIWKASEDIHALLHSLTDKEHADKVLGNLRNFIRNKHSVDAKKRDLFDNNVSAKKKKGNNSPVLKALSKVQSSFPDITDIKKSSIPSFAHGNIIDLKKKSGVANKSNVSSETKLDSIPGRTGFITPRNRKRRVAEYEKYTNHTSQGLERLYNQLATANARIPPTFADDADGWSSDDVSNVMSQLKSTDIDDDMPAGNVEFQDGVTSYAGRQNHVGLPQGNGHNAEVMPIKELIRYQKEVRNSMLQSKLLHNKNGLLSKSPIIPEYRKNEVSQLTAENVPSSHNNGFQGDFESLNSFSDNHASMFSTPLTSLTNSSVQLANGDYFEGTPEYNSNKNKLWLNRNFKKDLIHNRKKT